MSYKFSPSSLSLLGDCPRCFWLHFNKQIRRPSGPFPSLPSGMDRILKAHFDSFMAKGELPPELKNKLKGCKLFDKKELLEAWRNNLEGISWSDRKGNVLRGALDNVLIEKDGRLIVLDYKTRGFPLKEDTAEHYQDQLNIYNFLLRKNGYKTENYGYLLFYIPQKVNSKGHIIFNSTLLKRKTSANNALILFNKALKILEWRMPRPGKECKFCEWIRKNKH